LRALICVPLLLATAGAALAAEPLTGAEFESYATGKTLTYAFEGDVWGTEQYLPGRRVIWAFEGEECKRGTWYEEAGNICFLYEDREDAQCWLFFNEGGALRAQFAGDPEGTPLSELAQSTEPMPCPGPDVGV
jgi:hypothetical protein